MLSILALSLAAAVQEPSLGDLYRELATDRALYNRVDRNGDGQISDLEFDTFKRARRRGDTPARVSAPLGGYDINHDYALVPFELYPEADYDVAAPYREYWRAFYGARLRQEGQQYDDLDVVDLDRR